MATTYFVSAQACCWTFLGLSVYQKRIGSCKWCSGCGCQACISKQCKALTVMHCNGPVLESGQSAARGAKQQRAVNISGQSAASCTLVWLKWAWWWGPPERKGGISAATKSSCNQLCVQAQPCMFSAPFWKGLGNRMLQLTPSVAHLVLHYLQAIKVPCRSSSGGGGGGKELMIPFVLSQGTEPKQMTTTNPSNLAAVSTSALFSDPPEAWNAHIARRPPQAAGGPGTPGPSVARENLINDWSKLLCHQQGTTPTTATTTIVSYIILTALFFSCPPLSIQRPVIGVTLCTG